MIAEADAYFYHTASAALNIDNWEITLGITNLFEKEPPRVSPSYVTAVGNSALYSQYDILGRRAFLNLQYSF